jgi:hypothetical protein
MTKAIKIDVLKRELSYVYLDDYKDIYREIGNGCELFCVPIEFENADCIFCDDESLLKDVYGGFMMEGWSYPLCSNAIIQGTDEEGDSIDCLTTIEELLPQIIWVSEEDARKWQDHAILKGVEVYYK